MARRRGRFVHGEMALDLNIVEDDVLRRLKVEVSPGLQAACSGRITTNYDGALSAILALLCSSSEARSFQ